MNSLSITGIEPDVPADGTQPPVRQPLSFWKMALAVFAGNAITGVAAALVYFLATH
ncbi:MAG: hypothetical protein WBW84_13225 [Acidobacteriaceae bacterium]